MRKTLLASIVFSAIVLALLIALGVQYQFYVDLSIEYRRTMGSQPSNFKDVAVNLEFAELRMHAFYIACLFFSVCSIVTCVVGIKRDNRN